MRTRYGAAILLASAILLGCASQPQWPPHDTNPLHTITILTGSDASISLRNDPLDPNASGMYAHLEDWWNTYEQPIQGFDIQFDVIPGGATEQHSEMLAAAEGGDSSYDIFNLDSQWVSEFAAGGYIRSLAGRLDTSGFLPGPLRSAEDASGQLYAVPFTTDVGLLYYRSDLVSKPELSRVHSYSGLIGLAEKVLSGHPAGVTEGYAGQFSSYEGLTVNTLEAIWGHDKKAFGSDGGVSNPGAVEAGLSDLDNAFTGKGGGHPVVSQSELNLNFEEPQAAGDFANGKAVFMRNWPIWYPQLKTSTQVAGEPEVARIANDVQVTTLPFPSALGGQDLAISSHSPNPSHALEVAKFLTSLPVERCLFAVGGFPATLANAYVPVPDSSPITYDGYQVCGTDTGTGTSPIASTILAALRNAIPRPTTPYYTEFSTQVQSDVTGFLTLLASGKPSLDPGTAASTLISDLDAATAGRGPPGGG